jgi:myo-inositol-1(or 4)-monophosphatase
MSSAHPLINIAVKAARRAGKIIIRYFSELDTLKVHEKGFNDLVTLVDKSAENDIIDTIRHAYPEHSILGEESGFHAGNDEFVWVIDPLDGTMNYTHGFPHFAVSIGIKYREQVEHAVIYDPLSQDLYTASRGSGAKLNDRRIRVSKLNTLEGALIGTSFPFHNRDQRLDQYFKLFKEVYIRCADVRRTGSAALNLAYVAAGKLDGFWEPSLKPWDIAAGVLLVREAGGFITDFKGENGYLDSGDVVAGTRKVHAELLRAIQANLVS